MLTANCHIYGGLVRATGKAQIRPAGGWEVEAKCVNCNAVVTLEWPSKDTRGTETRTVSGKYEEAGREDNRR